MTMASEPYLALLIYLCAAYAQKGFPICIKLATNVHNHFPNLNKSNQLLQPVLNRINTYLPLMWFSLAKSIMGNAAVSYIILNVIRGLNILSLLASIIASGCLLVKTADLTDDIGWFNVFDLAEKVMVILFALFILLTELPKVLRGYFARNWPAFSHQSGFWALGVCLVFIGCDVMSYLCKEKTDQKHLGGDFYRMVQAAGLMCLIMAFVNMLASVLLRDRKRGLTARQARAFKKESQGVV